MWSPSPCTHRQAAEYEHKHTRVHTNLETGFSLLKYGQVWTYLLYKGTEQLLRPSATTPAPAASAMSPASAAATAVCSVRRSPAACKDVLRRENGRDRDDLADAPRGM